MSYRCLFPEFYGRVSPHTVAVRMLCSVSIFSLIRLHRGSQLKWHIFRLAFDQLFFTNLEAVYHPVRVLLIALIAL